MRVFEDKYALKDSVTVILEESDAKFLEVDFQDEESKLLNGEIYGFIKNQDEVPIKNANIKMFDGNYNFVMETFSDDDGIYLLTNVKPNIYYRVYVISSTIELENSAALSINELERYELNFILKPEKDKTFLAFKGTVMDLVSNKTVNDAVIYAFSLDNENNENLVAIESTDKNGEFYFWNLPPDNYLLKATATGYKTTSIAQFINGVNVEVEILIKLQKLNNILKGTIYGIIKDASKNPIPNADVVLYEINNISEIPIKFTKSDNDGVYLFEDIDDGNYKIKANKLIEGDI